jgi:DeoR family transcriptional regulator, suf operon transcriptional repressor
MHDVIGGLGGYRGVRADLLVTLKKEQPLTASELASRFGLTPNALRRHLKVLEEDGVVRYQREVRGVGAPVFAYRLTESGEAIFPRRYASVLASALTALQAERGGRSVARVLTREWDVLADDVGPVLEGLPLAERVQLVAELMTARGYMAEAEAPEQTEATTEATTETATLRIHNCAMCEIAEQFPEACEVEARQLARLLRAEVTRRAHRFDGAPLCSYNIAGPVADDAIISDFDDPTEVGATAPTTSGLTAWDEEQV